MKSKIMWVVAFQPRLWAGRYGALRWCAYSSGRAATNEVIRLRDGCGWRVAFGPKEYRCRIDGDDVYPLEVA